MDSETVPLPSKRKRITYHRNCPLTECIREFKLPQQFPSMATKSTTENETKLRCDFNRFTNLTLHPQLVQQKETSRRNKIIRKIKLKDTSGRELGVVNVEDLPQDIQGKTITLAKNGSKVVMSSSSMENNEKGVPIGVLTPVNVFSTNGTISYSLSDRKNSTLKCIAAVDQPSMAAKIAQGDATTLLTAQQTSTSSSTSEQRPKVLVYQSGQNWHMVKLGPAQSERNLSISRNINKPVAKKEMQSSKSKAQRNTQSLSRVAGNESNNFSSGIKASVATSRPSILTQRHRRKSLEIGNNESSLSTEGIDTETAKPTIEITRIYQDSNCVSALRQNSTDASNINLSNATGNAHAVSSALSSTGNNNLKKNVMVVLPRNVPASCYNETEYETEKEDIHEKPQNLNNVKEVSRNPSSETYNADVRMCNNRIQTSSKDDSTLGRKSDVPEIVLSTRENEKESEVESDAVRKKELTNGLCIVGKALSMVDHELRARALKALADCGIGVEKLVPIHPPSELKAVKDSQTQTSVFGILDREEFVCISEDVTNIQRIPVRERSSAQPQNFNHIIGNPHSQELIMFNRPDRLNSPLNNETKEMVEGFLEGNEGASSVKAIFAGPDPLRAEITARFNEDCRNCTEYDENGLLNIHKAVIDDHLYAVKRYLMVLRVSQLSVDIPTLDGQTSLELAVRYQVSDTIVKTLLNAGAEPTSMENGHDSALIIASKKSLPILTELIKYTSKSCNLDKCDSTGFSALHYCSQIGNLSGALDLVRASADINLRDRRSGRTPLFHAVVNKHNELSKMLMENGAQSSITNFSGQTVLSLIDDSNQFSV